jgi:hypothetical protein
MLTPICPGHCRWSLRMSVRRPLACLTLFVAATTSFAPSAKAGPLLDWLFGYRTAARPAYPVGQPVPIGNAAGGYAANMPIANVPVAGAPIGGYPVAGNPVGVYPPSGYAANYGNYYGSMMPVVGPSGYGYPAAQPNGVAAATAPTIMSYVPDYRTSQYRAPVTYYRPLVTTDPNTGAQVVALAPCTSYEYQTQRIPTFGYNGVMGSYSTPPVVPPPPSMPTYTLPSGGVPLAAGGPAAVMPPSSGAYAMGYGSPYRSYSLQQPAMPQQPILTAPPAGAYPTQPLSSAPGYYGSGSTGGSTGSYVSPSYTPGLVAPPAPYTPAPTTPYNPSSPYNSSPSIQGPSFPVNPPPSTMPRDPAGDLQPVLPPLGTNANLERPQLKAIVRQPVTNNSFNSEANAPAESRPSPGPTMTPIPVPADFEQQPRWNPGLLNEQDRTAQRPVTPSEHAGQSKSIQWASFKSESKPEPARQTNGMRALAPTSAVQPAVQNRPAQPAAAPRPANKYSTDGWNPVK